MNNYDYWKNFIMTGKIDDYLNYIACTREEVNSERDKEREEEGGFHAGICYRNRNGSVSNAGW